MYQDMIKKIAAIKMRKIEAQMNSKTSKTHHTVIMRNRGTVFENEIHCLHRNQEK